MISRAAWKSNTVIFGGLALWGLVLVSCVSVNRTLVAPPSIAGAKFVGSKECAQCHEKLTDGFHDATHAKMLTPGDNAKEIGCESCHGPGSLHAKSGGGAGTIVNPKNSPETCFQCHLDKRGEFSLPNTHPVLAGKMSCSDCHSPHGSVNARMLKARNQNLCLQCHFQQQTAPGVILIGGRDHASFLTRGTCWSAGCHEAVHGSHVSSSLRF